MFTPNKQTISENKVKEIRMKFFLGGQNNEKYFAIVILNLISPKDRQYTQTLTSQQANLTNLAETW